MDERTRPASGRVLLAGKIVFNAGRSAINCSVRNLFDGGAYLEVHSPVGIPKYFELTIVDIGKAQHCKLEWQTANRMGVSFVTAKEQENENRPASVGRAPEKQGLQMRGELLALRSALDNIEIGIVLLDHELRAQFINRAFRKFWRLSDARAESKPPFVALMYHGRDTRAYDIPTNDLDSYIAERVELVKAGDPNPIDIRLSNGEVFRYQCAVLPNNGRMLSYTFVTDIVRHSDRLEVLQAALDKVQDGVILLDDDLNATFMNRAVRRLWKVSDKQADACPAYENLVGDSRISQAYGVPATELEAFIAHRIALVKAGDPMPQDIPTSEGKVIRSRCTLLPTGGRILTYVDITDLIRNAELLEKLATVDAMTGVNNRRHFLMLAEVEWSRFQRYHRPLSMLMIDIDRFKSINDRFGHDVGDAALVWVAKTCQESKRTSDIVGRIGGEEFAFLLPETDLAQANVVAERLRKRVADHEVSAGGASLTMSVSIGVATASISMSGIAALMKVADRALYEAKAAGRNRVAQARAIIEPEIKLAAE